MRKYIIALGIGLAAAAATLYLLRTLPPLDSETVQQIVATERIVSEEELLAAIDRLGAGGQLTPFLNWRNLGLILATGFVAVAALFTFVHLLLAKITSGPFGRQPKVSTAVRRGAELGLIGITVAAFRLSVADSYLYILTPAFILFVEYLLSQPTKAELEQLYGPEILQADEKIEPKAKAEIVEKAEVPQTEEKVEAPAEQEDPATAEPPLSVDQSEEPDLESPTQS